MCYRQGDIDCAHSCLTTMYKSTRKQTWNLDGSLLICSQGKTGNFCRNHDVPPEKETTIHGTTYRFREEDAADGTSFAPSGPCKSIRQFPSSKTEHSTVNGGYGKLHQHDQKRGRLSPSSLRPVSFK